jgi:hypothetical protein
MKAQSFCWIISPGVGLVPTYNPEIHHFGRLEELILKKSVSDCDSFYSSRNSKVSGFEIP